MRLIFRETDGLEEGEDSGDELAERVVAIKRRCANGIMANAIRRKGTDPAVDVHGAEGREVFSYCLLAGCIWHTADSTLGAFCYLFSPTSPLDPAMASSANAAPDTQTPPPFHQSPNTLRKSHKPARK